VVVKVVEEDSVVVDDTVVVPGSLVTVVVSVAVASTSDTVWVVVGVIVVGGWRNCEQNPSPSCSSRISRRPGLLPS
jgi:hypothetical protein